MRRRPAFRVRVPTQQESPRPQSFGVALAAFIVVTTLGAVVLVNVATVYEVPQRVAAALNKGG